MQLAQVVRARKTIFPSAMFDRDRPHHAITIKSGYLCENVILEKIGKSFFFCDFADLFLQTSISSNIEADLEVVEADLDVWRSLLRLFLSCSNLGIFG